jgi:phosphate transport system permease protein
MIPRATRRKATNIIMFSLTGLCTLIAVSVLFFILGYLLWQGGHALSWNFFTQLPAPVGETGGGFANAILGSAKVLLLATAIGVPIGFLSGVYLAEFAGSKPAFVVRYTADLLNGVPSIVMGMFAYAIIVVPMGHFSTLAGGIALGVMMIPITVRSTEEFLRSVPNTLREGALALGATKWNAVATVVIPAALPGITTGVMLALARVAGETAPLLFTAFGNRFWSPGWNQPTATLPDTIYKYAISPYDEWHEQAWAAGLVLLLLVLAANVTSRYILRRRIQISRG